MRLLLGCAWLGAVAVPLNIAVKTRQLRFYLENSGARLLVAEATLLDALEADALIGLPLEQVLVLGGGAAAAGGLPVTGFVGTGQALPAVAVRPGDPFAILTPPARPARPKAWCACMRNSTGGGARRPLSGDRRGGCAGHDAAVVPHQCDQLLFPGAATGASQVVLPRFSASGYWREMTEAGATTGYLLGAMVPMLLAQTPNPYERAHRAIRN